jgi:pimeloyl-ACP methyl ester carboxylesterase
VGHDWGSSIGWETCRWRPDRVIAYIAVSVSFLIRDPDCSGVTKLTALLGEGIYVNLFQVSSLASAPSLQASVSDFLILKEEEDCCGRSSCQ